MADQINEKLVPEFVGNSFAKQYYQTLCGSPHLAHMFYSDLSMISRPGPDGVMTSTETLQGISETLVSLNYQDSHIEILTVDSQYSHKGGVMVLVTAYLVGNGERKKFAQTFFLAPQESGSAVNNYFCLNDVFRFVDDVANEISREPAVELTQSPVDQPAEVEIESTVTEIPVNQVVEIEESIVENGHVALENGHANENCHVEENGLPEKSAACAETDPNVNVSPEVPVSPPLEPAAPGPKKSFASVVSALKKNAAPFQVRAHPPPKPAAQPRARVPSVPKPEAPAPAPAPALALVPAPAPVANGAPENIAEPPVKAHAIFVANLPMSATVDELEKLFQQFGPIKQDGIQVRSSKPQGTCFGFVEFESASAMQSALEASPVVFGTRKLSIEERRANNERPKFQSGRSGYRNDNFRGGRGGNNNNHFNGNRSFGRNEFSGRPRGNGHGPRNSEPNHNKPNNNSANAEPKPAQETPQVKA